MYQSNEAKRLADRLVSHDTLKHGSWLNQEEIELGIVTKQCLDRRILDVNTLTKEVAVWEKSRNE